MNFIVMNTPKNYTKRWASVASVALLMMMWLLAIIGYMVHPATVPIHFDLHGKADNWGSPVHIWLQPAMATIIAIMFAALRLPQTRPLLTVAVLFVLCAVSALTTIMTLHPKTQLGGWLAPLVAAGIALMLGETIWFVWKR